jgi:hypothetical protein
MAADTMVPASDVVSRGRIFHYLEWGPVIVGAIGAAAISFVLYVWFGARLRRRVVVPYRGVSATTFFVIAAAYAALVQVVSYAAGGYLAGRLRTPSPELAESEQQLMQEFADGNLPRPRREVSPATSSSRRSQSLRRHPSC